MPTHQKGRRELLNRRGVFQEHLARGNLSFDVDLRGEGRKKKKKKSLSLLQLNQQQQLWDYTARFPSLAEYWVRSLGPASDGLNRGPGD